MSAQLEAVELPALPPLDMSKAHGYGFCLNTSKGRVCLQDAGHELPHRDAGQLLPEDRTWTDGQDFVCQLNPREILEQREAQLRQSLAKTAEFQKMYMDLYRVHRWNIKEEGSTLLICKNEHERSAACEFTRWFPEWLKDHSYQMTNCAWCGEYKHTPIRDDEAGYVCAGCVEKKYHKTQSEMAHLITKLCIDVTSVEYVEGKSRLSQAVPIADNYIFEMKEKNPLLTDHDCAIALHWKLQETQAKLDSLQQSSE